MRSLFNKVLVDTAKTDQRIWMILADIGYGEIEPFRDAFPDRWYNCGVAEPNMTGVACGVALEGNIAITYSIAIMRALPNIVVFCPCDFAEAEAGVHAMIARDGPFYYRCGYKQEPPVHQDRIAFRLGRAIQVRDGRDLTFIFTGTIGNQVTEAAEALSREGIQCRVLSMHTVKPIDRAAIRAAAEETGGVVVVEEHQLSGGLGGAVAEVLADACVAPRRFLRIGLPDVYVSKVGEI